MEGRKRKTFLYWKENNSEVGWDLTDVARLSEDMEGWKARVRERMKHLNESENQKGLRNVWREEKVLEFCT